MSVRKAIFLTLITFLIAASAYKANDSISRQKELNSMLENQIIYSQPRIATPYDDIDSWNIPTVVPFNDEQRSYLLEVISAMMRVMAESSPLKVEEQKILGSGKFRWPKNPTEPIKTLKSYPGENFRISGIAASFRRQSENAPWSQAGLTVHPRNFPTGVYLMHLPPTFFDGFKLREVTQEDRKDERIKSPLVFYFEHKKIESFHLKIETRDDVANIRDSFPSSFHALVMTRDPQ